MMNSGIDISIIIPAYNEAKRLPPFLSRVLAFCKNSRKKYEIIIVDDGSTDGTCEIAASFKPQFADLVIIRIPNNSGKGHAVKTGFLSARGYVAVFLDADGSVEPDEIEKNLHYLNEGGYDIFTGSRELKGESQVLDVRWYRKIPGTVFNFFVRTFLFKDIRDTQCGFKMFRKEVIKPVFSRSRLRGFSFDFEILFIAHKMGYRIKEGPVSWKHIHESKVNMLTDPVKMLIDILRVRNRHYNLNIGMQYSLKQKLGAVLFDLPRLFEPWVLMRNRNERLIANPSGRGVKCDWQWTSDLHFAKVFPSLGRLFMQRALRDYPIALKNQPEKSSAAIDISFIIGHRGLERLPHLLLTLRSIAAQADVSLECIVVEQSIKEDIKASLPNWARYIHTPLPRPDLPYCRSWALNVGARQAKGRLLVLHDNDFLVPQVYSSELMKEFSKGSEVINLKRFIFYLSQEGTQRILHGLSSPNALIGDPELDSRFRGNDMVEDAPERIVQNLEAGGSVAVSREAYFAIGGFDESFIGWGGEDNEFWDRAQTQKICPYGYLPLVHLWHAAQPDKHYSDGQGRYTGDVFKERMSVPREKRIEELTNDK